MDKSVVLACATNQISRSRLHFAKHIAPYAFEFLKLTWITLPDGLETIGEFAFHGCSSLRECSIPESVQIIGDSAFEDCALEEISLPRITRIGNCAFSGCSLDYIDLGSSLISIGDRAFYCKEGEEEHPDILWMTIPSTIETIGEYAFSGLGVKYVEFSSSYLDVISTGMFANCRALQTVSDLPSSITEIRPYAFANCSSLYSDLGLKYMNILTNISAGAFSGCTQQVNIIIPMRPLPV